MIFKKLTTSLIALSVLISVFAAFPPVSARAVGGVAWLPYSTLQAIPFLGSFITQELIDGPWYNPGTCQFLEKVYDAPEDEIFGERYTFAQVNWIINSITAQVFPFNLFYLDSPFDILRGMFGSGERIEFKDFAKLGIPGLLMGNITQMYERQPASGMDITRSTLAKFSVVSPAHAQGFGYTSLEPLRVLWSASRNVVYLIMVVFLLAAGFMIMFRVKVNPQTAVTVQMMIPRIIITLLLVTFSYAIAGFVLDLIYVVISLLISSFGSVINAPLAISQVTGPITNFFFYYLMVWMAFGIAVPILGPLFTAVMTIIILFLIFKVWWLLLKTYITLMFLIILGPWQIMLGLLPNNQGFSSWFKNLIAHASVFVVIPIMFIFSTLFWNIQDLLVSFANQVPLLAQIYAFIADLIGATGSGNIAGELPHLPLFSTGDFIFNLAIGYAILALMPKAADMVRDAIKAPAFKYGTALGEGLGPISGPVGGMFAARGKSNLEIGASTGNWVQQVKGGVQQTISGQMQRR